MCACGVCVLYLCVCVCVCVCCAVIDGVVQATMQTMLCRSICANVRVSHTCTMHTYIDHTHTHTHTHTHKAVLK